MHPAGSHLDDHRRGRRRSADHPGVQEPHGCRAGVLALNWERSSSARFIKDMNDFGKINALYEAAFGAHKPARSCVEVSRLPKDVLVEIEAIATLS
ncbi:hypothetical protein CPB85DRAFT_702954 [Mucidula mucida]|nr:hypothetical protein CPB85DRAFT_702954 [Mucidula mucida]